MWHHTTGIWIFCTMTVRVSGVWQVLWLVFCFKLYDLSLSIIWRPCIEAFLCKRRSYGGVPCSSFPSLTNLLNWRGLICNMKSMYRNILLQRWTWWSSLLLLYLSYRPLKLTCGIICNMKSMYRSILVQRWTWWSPLLLLSVFYRSLKLTCDLICNMKAIYRSILVQRWPWWNPLLLLSFSYRPLKLHAELLLDKDHSGIS